MNQSPLPPSPRSPLWTRVLSGGAIAMVLLLSGGCQRLKSSVELSPEEIQALTVTVQQENIQATINASGTVEPIRSVNISPKNTGKVIALLVEQGDRVTAGQRLAVMDNNTLAAQKRQAEANYRQSLANLEAGKIRLQGEIQQAQLRWERAQQQYQEIKNRLPEQREQRQAQVRSAQNRLTLAQQRQKRYQTLLLGGAITQDQFDEVDTELANAQANLDNAQRLLAETETTDNPQLAQAQASEAEAASILDQRRWSYDAEINTLEASAKSAQAQLQVVQSQFDDSIITAPFDGIVTQKYATEGAFVAPTTSASSSASATSTSIFALAQGLEVVAKIPEIDLPQVTVGQRVMIRADAFPGEVFEGEVSLVSPEAIVEQNVTSFEVRIPLRSGLEQLRSNMNVDVEFLGNELDDGVVVPTVAIVTQRGETGVLILNGAQEPEFVAVTLGVSLGDRVQVLSGVEPGQQVFIDLPRNWQREFRSETE